MGNPVKTAEIAEFSGKLEKSNQECIRGHEKNPLQDQRPENRTKFKISISAMSRIVMLIK
jgi:hypothetical protein